MNREIFYTNCCPNRLVAFLPRLMLLELNLGREFGGICLRSLICPVNRTSVLQVLRGSRLSSNCDPSRKRIRDRFLRVH